tara:strand:+ start:774 stop:1664 length:891 start_codon:yes stop_codon:yes gene_type:complete
MHTDISTNRLISKFPKKIQQWSVLLRLDRPIGWWLLVLPSWWVILLQSISIMHSLKLILLFTIGAILMRGAGCVVNDLWDKDIDAKVERTKKRPIASGEVSIKEAFMGLIVILIFSCFILFLLPLKSFILAIISLPLIVLYPLSKRFTKYPQFFLGLVFSWGVPLGWSATNTDLNFHVVLLYLGTIAWVFAYDTIYSLQDVRDDIKIKINSTALTFGANTKIAIGVSYFIAFIFFINVSWSFLWVSGVILVGFHMIWQVQKLDINSQILSLKLFKSNRDLGLILSLFAFIDLYFRY